MLIKTLSRNKLLPLGAIQLRSKEGVQRFEDSAPTGWVGVTHGSRPLIRPYFMGSRKTWRNQARRLENGLPKLVSLKIASLPKCRGSVPYDDVVLGSAFQTAQHAVLFRGSFKPVVRLLPTMPLLSAGTAEVGWTLILQDQADRMTRQSLHPRLLAVIPE